MVIGILLEGVEETLTQLSVHHDLMLITKGDLFEQEAKIIRSGLADRFSKIEIVRTKTPEAYRKLVAKHHLNPERFLMVGNSLKSDILPVMAIGGRAIYIPYETTWAHEIVPEEELTDKDFFRLFSIGELPELIERLKTTAN